MDEEQLTREAIKNPENQEAPSSVESPEALRQNLISEAGKEVENFQSETKKEIERIESQASQSGLAVNAQDSAGLRALNEEAGVARADLLAEITPQPSEQEKTDKKEETIKKNICPQCGREVGPNANFCTECGAKLLKKAEESGKKSKVYDNSAPATKERVIESPEVLLAREASKKSLATELSQLAQELWVARQAQRQQLIALETDIKNVLDSPENFDGQREDQQFGRFAERQSEEANKLSVRLASLAKLSGQDVKEEWENISQLVANSEELAVLEGRLKEHYAKIDEEGRERFDTLNRSLEQVIRRNNAFMIHVIAEGEGIRHNANSNVSAEATYLDDIDIMLSLEPAVSASSVIPGDKSDLWPGSSGFLLGGGQIGEAGQMDQGTHSLGIKERKSAGGKKATIEKIDEIVGQRGRTEMNEVVVNNAEVFGFFQHAGKGEDGRFWSYDTETKKYADLARNELVSGGSRFPGSYTNILKKNTLEYRKRFDAASERGLPLYIMTPEREVYECLGVNDDGSVEIGKQLTPEEVATGRAGLPAEKRKEIGQRLLEKKIFKEQETQQEAKEIVGSL